MRLFQKSNFSATTTPQIFQKTLETSVDKRMGNTYGPPIGKTMTIFIDDLNQPEISPWGDQVQELGDILLTQSLLLDHQRAVPVVDRAERFLQPGEARRLHHPDGGVGRQGVGHCRTADFMQDMRYLSAMIHPGGGRNDIPERLKR